MTTTEEAAERWLDERRWEHEEDHVVLGGEVIPSHRRNCIRCTLKSVMTTFAEEELERAAGEERTRWWPVVEIAESIGIDRAREMQKDDHLNLIDHKDEMDFGDLVEAVIIARGS